MNYDSRPCCNYCNNAREVPEQQEAMAAAFGLVAVTSVPIKQIAPVAANPPTIKLIAPTIKLWNFFDALADLE